MRIELVFPVLFSSSYGQGFSSIIPPIASFVTCREEQAKAYGADDSADPSTGDGSQSARRHGESLL